MYTQCLNFGEGCYGIRDRRGGGSRFLTLTAFELNQRMGFRPENRTFRHG